MDPSWYPHPNPYNRRHYQPPSLPPQQYIAPYPLHANDRFATPISLPPGYALMPIQQTVPSSSSSSSSHKSRKRHAAHSPANRARNEVRATDNVDRTHLSCVRYDESQPMSPNPKGSWRSEDYDEIEGIPTGIYSAAEFGHLTSVEFAYQMAPSINVWRTQMRQRYPYWSYQTVLEKLIHRSDSWGIRAYKNGYRDRHTMSALTRILHIERVLIERYHAVPPKFAEHNRMVHRPSERYAYDLFVERASFFQKVIDEFDKPGCKYAFIARMAHDLLRAYVECPDYDLAEWIPRAYNERKTKGMWKFTKRGTSAPPSYDNCMIMLNLLLDRGLIDHLLPKPSSPEPPTYEPNTMSPEPPSQATASVNCVVETVDMSAATAASTNE